MSGSGALREMTPWGLSCGSCGTELPEKAKFCSQCGVAVSAGTKPAEYKQVTVVFAGVVDSMDIAAAVGAERLREIMAELVDRSSVVVQRYSGTVDNFTGDGIMAVFGAPVALEDHAVRACLAALGIQQEAKRLAVDVHDRDGVELLLRVGLNSGQVIAGEIGSGPFGYTTVGEQVGMAQRMESVAPPGGVMLSESTARLVYGVAVLSEPEMVRIKGAEDAVSARRLLSMAAQPQRTGLSGSTLVGREWELDSLAAILDRSIGGRGSVVGVVGPAGIGKTRLAGEAAQLATSHGVEVFSTFCESHATDVPFRVVARLLRAVTQVRGLDEQTARARLREGFPDADPQDMLLLDDLLGIADPAVELTKMDPDARRRRLIALINTAQLARTRPAVFIVEDVHWIDEVSESMLTDFLTVIPQIPALVLVTYRPEYTGALSRVPGAQSIALAPLTDPETATLVSQLLGPDPSVGELGQMIAERAAGNPFFAEEMVRELAERGVLRGQRGTYMSTAGVAEVSVPATLQATIAARLDRLDPKAKRTLSAAAVIGSRFSLDLLKILGIEPILEDLVVTELVDQVRFTRGPEYVFHHPLIRTVAYESQLKSDRAELHRLLAAAIEARSPASADENAALTAEHLEAAGDLHAAYGWHMRAGAWSAKRDINAARVSWQRACDIADRLSVDDAGRTPMRIAPRTLLCGTGWRVRANISGTRFEELRQLCSVAGDKASLAVGMAGLMMEHTWHSRVREASQLASEFMALVESIGDSTLTIGLSFAAIVAKVEAAELPDVLRWAQTIIDLADGDPTKGNLIIGSPLAVALAWRGVARWSMGLPAWREDLDHAVAMAQKTDPITHAAVIAYKYGTAIPRGVLLPDDAALSAIGEALQIAERSSDDVALGVIELALGIALIHRDSPDRERGLQVLAKVRDMCLNDRYFLNLVPVVDVYAGRETAVRGDQDGAVLQLRRIADDVFNAGQLAMCDAATRALVETLLGRGATGDVQEAQAAVDRLAATQAKFSSAVRDILLLRLRALLARAHGDAAAYAHFRDRYATWRKRLASKGISPGPRR